MNRCLTKFLLVGAGFCWVSACKGGDNEEMLRRLNQANDKVVECKGEVSGLKSQVADLKHQIAEAAGNPNRLQLNDPEILNLIADLRKQKRVGADGDGLAIGKGDLKPQDASRVVKQHAQAMQVCYERALKRNSALQYQMGLALVVELTVKSTGAVKEVNVRPSVDADMTSCFQTAAMRWKFPPFGGEPVVVAQKVTLTPKT
ncbi:MAG: AgmX/PglI C-terminal domain-containing protein [Polyangia bacterium]